MYDDRELGLCFFLNKPYSIYCCCAQFQLCTDGTMGPPTTRAKMFKTNFSLLNTKPLPQHCRRNDHAQKQECHRPRIARSVTRHDETGTPQQHKNNRSKLLADRD